jgi:hypothetical protein
MPTVTTRLIATALYLFMLSASIRTACPAADPALDKYGGLTGIKGEATGFFHTEKIDDRYWLVTPEGNAFLPLHSAICFQVRAIWRARKSMVATERPG